jgi:hypothetical protein
MLPDPGIDHEAVDHGRAPLPVVRASYDPQAASHDPVEPPRQAVAGFSPAPHLRERQYGASTIQHAGLEGSMGDRVSPAIHLLVAWSGFMPEFYHMLAPRGKSV